MPWELIKIKQTSRAMLEGVISIRKNEIAISRDLVDKYFRKSPTPAIAPVVPGEIFSNIQLFINRETGEMGLHPSTDNEGYKLKGRTGKTSCVLNTRRFLREHPIKVAYYIPRWDPGSNLLIIKVWDADISHLRAMHQLQDQEDEAEDIQSEAKVEQPSEDQDQPKVDFCPECEELGFKNGVCPHCGYHVICPKGFNKPLEKEEEICRDCGDYKRAWGDRPAACKWEGWK